MRKQFIIGMMALLAVVLAGCEKNEPCTCGKQTPCAFHKTTIDIPVKQEEWKFDNKAHQFYVHVPVTAITEEVYNYGEFSISREMDGDDGPYQAALPMSTFHEVEVEYEDHTTGFVYYQELIDFRVGIGYVEIQVTNSDFSYYQDQRGQWINPEGMLFRVQLTY